MSITYSLVQSSDIPRAYSLESSSYPSDEAASLSSLEYRQTQASPYFLGAYKSSELIGFICSTLTSSPTLTHASIESHEPTGEYLAIHSVCVDANHRKQGIARGMLKEYLRRVGEEEQGKVIKGVRLISKQHLVGLYQGVGFVNKGKSEIVHGKDSWFELAIDFDPSSFTSKSPFVSPEDEDVPKTEMRSPGKRLSPRTSEEEVLKAVKGEGDGKNLCDLYCPRGECRCLLVKKGTAKWVQQHEQDLDLPALPHRLTSSSPPTLRPLGHWSLPSPLSFENIGFTRSLPSSSSCSSGPQQQQHEIKYLTCADCDFGPLGWHDTQGRDLGLEVAAENEGRGEVRGGREFLLDLERVRYKVE